MNEAIHPLFTDFLMNKKENHKKTQNLYPSEGMKDYLVNENTTVEEKQLMFILRSRMLKTTSKTNIKTFSVHFVRMVRKINTIFLFVRTM